MNYSMLPCPFCGGSGNVKRHITTEGKTAYEVICRKCGSGVSTEAGTAEKAVALWNVR